jgi:carbon-monoxide dehydrogenase large subunit
MRRLEDARLLQGAGQYVDDVADAGVLHVAFVRSPYPHALVLSIDCAVAAAAPGVHAVLTLDDLSPVLARRRMLRGARAVKLSDKAAPHVLANGEVAYVGEAIAMVIADDRYLAEDAAGLVVVTYDPLPAVSDCRAAIAADAPRVLLENVGNIAMRHEAGYGDVAAAFAGAAHVLNCELWQHRGCAHPMETRGVLAEVRNDALCITASTQLPHDVQAMAMAMLDLDDQQIRVITPDVGGGFGPKYCVYADEIAVAAAAWMLRRSIKWIEDRREHFTCAVQERDQFWSIQVAANADGTLRGVRGSIIYDQGAYLLKDANLPYNSATAMPGPYLLPAYDMQVLVAQTNKVPASSVRGAGYPEAVFAMERVMDLLARELGLDRAEVRRRNLIPLSKMPYAKPMKARSGAAIVYDSGDYPASQAAALAAADWDGFPDRQARARASGRFIGIGMANAVKGTGRGPFESATVRITPAGRVSVATGATAMGQGLATALAQITADELGVAPEDVAVVAGDTGSISLGLGGFASRQLVTAGSSVRLAAAAVATKARQLASRMMEVAPDDLELTHGEVRVVGVPGMKVGLGELARVLRGAPGAGFPEGFTPGLEATEAFRTDALAYANTTHVCEVEIDIETGEARILSYLALQDCGRLVNPLIVEGQIQGGIAHGIGNALFEFMNYDADANPVTTNFGEYLLPTATDVPRFTTLYRESLSTTNPLGAKGVGEVGTIPVAAAVISAIEDALAQFGVRMVKTPALPEDILRIIADAPVRSQVRPVTSVAGGCRWSEGPL